MDRNIRGTHIEQSEAGQYKPEKPAGIFFFIAPYILIVLIFIIFMVKLVADYHPVTVSGSSMEPTYESFDILTTEVNFTKKDIFRGTVICFDPDDGYGTYIKRVVGVPGDHVKINKTGLWVNGKKAEEKLDKPAVYGDYLDVTLKEDEYYVLGDNREDSRDSRVIGPVNYSSIKCIVERKMKVKDLLPGG